MLIFIFWQVARPQDDLQGFYSTTGSIHFYRPEENLLKTTAQPFPFQYKGVHPSSSPTCRRAIPIFIHSF